MEGIEISKHKISRPKQTSAVFSLQYNFKPPINESFAGSAVVKEENESTWKHPNQSHEEISSYDATGRKSTIKGKKRALEGKEEEEEEDKVKDRGRGAKERAI